ncbi:hypothetical protein GPK34_00400 [Secundilactobacillus kimchicus]|uniref:hypothetical protein n=1 Tax=Secundilactobacillus kimchicus TaxID=528209 RepID=UPI001C01CF6D|nr:hypothetical protein [Secundilactobacillus kimchicus]MBT9670497.1 hypothetical protein [Secundilactobacillus kimchicus]
MTKVELSKNTEKGFDVLSNGDNYGKLLYDLEQGLWVLWPELTQTKTVRFWGLAQPDGVSYFDSLKDTVETIEFELNNTDELTSEDEDPNDFSKSFALA